MKKVDLVKLTLTDEGEMLTGVCRQLRDDLGNTQLRRILGYMDKVAQIIAESIAGGGNKNE